MPIKDGDLAIGARRRLRGLALIPARLGGATSPKRGFSTVCGRAFTQPSEEQNAA